MSILRLAKKKFLLATPDSVLQPGRVIGIKVKGYDFLASIPFTHTEETFFTDILREVSELEDSFTWMPAVKSAVSQLPEGVITNYDTYHVPFTVFPLRNPFYDFRTIKRTRKLSDMSPRTNPVKLDLRLKDFPYLAYGQLNRIEAVPDKKILVIIAQNPGKAEVASGVPMVYETGMIVRSLLAQYALPEDDILVLLDNATPAFDAGKQKVAQFLSWYSRIRLLSIKSRIAFVALGASALNFLLQEGALRINAYVGKHLWGGHWNAPIFIGLHPSAIVRSLRINHKEIESTYPGDFKTFGDFRIAVKKVFSDLLYGKYKSYLYLAAGKAIKESLEWLRAN